MKINGKLCYLWRAVDREGEVLETVVTAERDKAAALKFLKRIMKKYGRPKNVVIDGLCSYPAAMKEIGNADRSAVGSTTARKTRINPFDDENELCSSFGVRRHCKKFSSIHAQVHNHFNQKRHLVTREIYEQRRWAALAEWRTVMA